MEGTFGRVMLHLIALRKYEERKEEAKALMFPLETLPRLTKFLLYGIYVHE